MSPLRRQLHYPNSEFLEHFESWSFCDNVYQCKRRDFSARDSARLFENWLSLWHHWRGGYPPMKGGTAEMRLFDFYLPTVRAAKLLHDSQA